MIGEDAKWYLKNRSKISAFQNYITLVESDILPTQIGYLVKSAVDEAVRSLASDDTAWTVKVFSNADGFDVYWSPGNSYNEDKEIGTWLSVWIPKRIEWMDSTDDDCPVIGLCSYYGEGPRGKSKTRKIGQLASKALLSFPSTLGKKCDKFDDVFYVSVQRLLNDILDENSLNRPDKLKIELMKFFKKFSSAALPGLKAVQKYST